MNLYGDTGNVIVLTNRITWRKIELKVSKVGLKQALPLDADLIVGSGGQDASQSLIQKDLQDKAESLHKLAEQNVAILVVCGLYQLFGRHFITTTKTKIEGIGILPIETVAGANRIIGNINVESIWGNLVGYENHSGQTYLDDQSLALGKVIKGVGNNEQDKTEGCRYRNVFGTYLHGPVLSKNPKLADELIIRALSRNYKNVRLPALDDQLETKAAEIAFDRPR